MQRTTLVLCTIFLWRRLLRILSIRQPWADLIACGYKEIENRDWATPYRGSLLIHASKNFDRDAPFEDIAGRIGQEGYCHLLEHLHFGGVVGMAQLVDIVTESTSPWFCGRYGWVLKNARPLPFFPMRGQLSLFVPSRELIEHVSRHH